LPYILSTFCLTMTKISSDYCTYKMRTWNRAIFPYVIPLGLCTFDAELIVVIGSILSNLCRCLQKFCANRSNRYSVLVLGMCFFAGGIKFSEQGFGASTFLTYFIHWIPSSIDVSLITGATQLNSSLLTISVIAILLPNAFRFAVTLQSDPDAGQDILKVSHGVCFRHSDFSMLIPVQVALILLFSWCLRESIIIWLELIISISLWILPFLSTLLPCDPLRGH
jgi:Ca2+:H+ antiporter